MKLKGYWFITVAILLWCCVNIRAEEVKLKPNIKAIDSSTGLYFDVMGQIFFYPTQWKVVSYVNLKPTQMLWKQVKGYQSQIINYCMKVQNATWYSLTDCRAFAPYIRPKVRYVDRLKDIVADYLHHQKELNVEY
jgi:hypothetical protein